MIQAWIAKLIVDEHRLAFHVAFMSRGPAGLQSESLEMLGNRRNTMQHEKGLFRGLISSLSL